VKLGVFGGTFDPPHVGHLILAQLALEQLKLDKVLFIPAGDPWRKADRKVTGALHRLAMTQLAAAGNACFEVEDYEVVREGPSYTVETLSILRDHFGPDAALYLIVGEDALADLPHWREPARIADLATVAVANRRGVTLPPLPFDASRIVPIAMPGIDISSTELRSRAAEGKTLRYQVPDAVIAYVEEHALYRADPHPSPLPAQQGDGAER
jgi:nicotinate-nucleotide adenylyltransferase